MDLPSLLPKLGIPVPTDVLNLDKISDASQGELLHAGVQLIMMATKRMAEPASFHDIPTYQAPLVVTGPAFSPVSRVASKYGEPPADLRRRNGGAGAVL